MRLPNGYGGIIKLPGRRRRPYMVRKTAGWHFDVANNKKVQDFFIVGYATTKAEALQMLADFNNNPIDLSSRKVTFQQIYEKWSEEKFPTISKSNASGYNAAYKVCTDLYNRAFRELRLADLQHVIDSCNKNFPTLRKVKVLFNQMYDYAMKNDLCEKDYSEYVDIIKYKNRNPNKMDRNKFSKADVARLWELKEDKYYQTILMLIYTGVRISELLDLKKENVHLDKQYFDVLISKTENGIRKVPIADKVLPFFEKWYNDTDSEYLLHTNEGSHFAYRNYYDTCFSPLMKQLGFTQTPHCCRHTCISMLAEAHVDQTIIKKIVGHSGAMTLTEKVYTHFDIEELINAINKI